MHELSNRLLQLFLESIEKNPDACDWKFQSVCGQLISDITQCVIRENMQFLNRTLSTGSLKEQEQEAQKLYLKKIRQLIYMILQHNPLELEVQSQLILIFLHFELAVMREPYFK